MLMYAYVVWPREERDQLGKAIPQSARVETYKISSDQSSEDESSFDITTKKKKRLLSDNPGAVARREQRIKKKQMREAASSTSTTPASDICSTPKERLGIPEVQSDNRL